jgi:hypothetical protein
MSTRRFFVLASGCLSARLALWAQKGSVPSDAVFIFQNNFWVNLHHFLRAESRRRGMQAPLELPLSTLNAEERAGWQRGLDGYVEFSRLSLVFDEPLPRINNDLAQAPDSGLLRDIDIESKIAAALNDAAPVYRAHRWAEHRKENADWIAAHGPAIREHAVAVRQAIADAFHAVPLREPIIVDLARDIGPNLAYTTGGPKGTGGHTVIAPQKNANSEVALNTIFHEISHTMDSQITQALDREAERQGVKPPRDLWHAVTLYTTWKIVKRELGKEGAPAYRPDVDTVRMFERNGWRTILAILEKDWQPRLDGNAAFPDALGDLVQHAARQPRF